MHKWFADQFILKTRSAEKDREMIKAQINEYLPLVDPNAEQNKKGKKKNPSSTTSKKTPSSARGPGGGNRNQSRPSSTERSNSGSRASMIRHDRSELTVLREQVEDDEESSSEDEVGLLFPENNKNDVPLN